MTKYLVSYSKSEGISPKNKEPNGFVLLKTYRKKYLSRGLHSEIYILELNIISIPTIMKSICVNLITFGPAVSLAIVILDQLYPTTYYTTKVVYLVY